jgi:hypothetical protein
MTWRPWVVSGMLILAVVLTVVAVLILLLTLPQPMHVLVLGGAPPLGAPGGGPVGFLAVAKRAIIGIR